MITSGKYAGNYIALNASKVAFVSRDPVVVNEQTMVSSMYQDDVKSISIMSVGAAGDEAAVAEWLGALKAAGEGDNKVYTVRIIWHDGEISIANITDTQSTRVWATRAIQKSQIMSQKPAEASTVNANTQSAEKAKEVEKKFFAMLAKPFLLIGIGGMLLISLVSLALYGKIYVFGGEAYTAALWIVCFLFTAIGMVGALGATGKEKSAMTVAFAIIGIVILCILFVVGNFFSGIFSGGDDKWDTCYKCGGDGITSSSGVPVKCPRCNGVGYIP